MDYRKRLKSLREDNDYTQEKVLKPFDLVMCNTQQTAIDFSKVYKMSCFFSSTDEKKE